MNKKIRDIYSKVYPFASAEGERAAEKFAFLVLQECLLALEPDPYIEELAYEVQEKLFERSASLIKNHFGIK